MQNDNPERKSDTAGDPWASLRSFTAARIALGRTGTAIPLQRSLAFSMAHAFARDAVHSTLNIDALQAGLAALGLPVCVLHSRAANRQMYLQRPDYGRCLSEASRQQLAACASNHFHLSITIADGLSAAAINAHALPVMGLLVERCQQKNLTLAPVCLVQQGRVAVGDETGSLLHAHMAVVLIGERPGLTAPDSMGAYLSFHPQQGLTDASRNCVSNIRPEGLAYEAAAEKIMYLIEASFRLQLSGVGLKDAAMPTALGE